MPPVSNLPERYAGAADLVRRAEQGLAAVRNIQLETSAAYWYERGCGHKLAQEWDGARYCFTRATELDPYHCRAWLFAALAHCHLDELDAGYTCIVEAYLTGVVETEQWLGNALSKEELDFLGKKVDRHLLTQGIRMGYYWPELGSPDEASRFVPRVLAAAVIIYAVWVAKGGYYSQYNERDNDFTGGFGYHSQPASLGRLLDRILDCSGITQDFYNPPPQDGRLVARYALDSQGNKVQTTEMELRDCSWKHLFSQQHLQILLDVTASLLGGARRNLPRFYQRIADAGYGSGYASFHVGQSLLEEKKYAEAAAALRYAAHHEPRFATSAVYWERLATALLHGRVPPWWTDAFTYEAAEPRPASAPAETGEALRHLEQAAGLTRDKPAAWIKAGNAYLYHVRDFQRALACYQTAVAQCRAMGGQEVLLPKIWGLYNSARIYFELDTVAPALDAYRSLAATLNYMLRSYYGEEGFAGEDYQWYESQLVAPAASGLADLLRCGNTAQSFWNGTLFLRHDLDVSKAVAA